MHKTSESAPATTAQLARLSGLGVDDAELALMVHRGYTAARAHELILELVAYPVGAGALRHWRIFGEYPRGVAFGDLSASDQATVAAWLAVDAAAEHIAAADYDSAEGRAVQLVELARNGEADAGRNTGIIDRIDAVLLMVGPSVRAAAPTLAGRLRRAAREWRALSERQRARRARADRMARAVRRRPVR